jgi:hypothetical protein
MKSLSQTMANAKSFHRQTDGQAIKLYAPNLLIVGHKKTIIQKLNTAN